MPKPVSAEKKLEWETKIRQQRESGLSIDRWCRQNQVTSCSFLYWKNHLQPGDELARSCFTELPIDLRRIFKIGSRKSDYVVSVLGSIRRKFFEAESGDLPLRDWVLRKMKYLFMLERVSRS